MKSLPLLSLLACLLALPVARAADEASLDAQLVQARKTFVSSLEAIRGDHAERSRAYDTKYGDGLSRLVEVAKQGADLDRAIALRAELKRFAESGAVTEGDLVDDPAALRTLLAGRSESSTVRSLLPRATEEMTWRG